MAVYHDATDIGQAGMHSCRCRCVCVFLCACAFAYVPLSLDIMFCAECVNVRRMRELCTYNKANDASLDSITALQRTLLKRIGQEICCGPILSSLHVSSCTLPHPLQEHYLRRATMTTTAIHLGLRQQQHSTAATSSTVHDPAYVYVECSGIQSFPTNWFCVLSDRPPVLHCIALHCIFLASKSYRSESK
jgi:hypothetical protein